MLRPGTTDRKVFDEVFIDQIYAPALRCLEGIRQPTIVDLGANIGLSTVFFLNALPAATATAVEPDPGNFDLLRENLYRTGVDIRSHAVRAFAGGKAGFAELLDSGNGAWGMRMGPPSAKGTPVMPLAAIARQAGMGRISLLKCDIEGAERELFEDLAGWEDLVEYVVLELHADLFPVHEFLACLAESRYHWTLHGAISENGPLSVVVLERAGPRPVVAAMPSSRARPVAG